MPWQHNGKHRAAALAVPPLTRRGPAHQPCPCGAAVPKGRSGWHLGGWRHPYGEIFSNYPLQRSVAGRIFPSMTWAWHNPVPVAHDHPPHPGLDLIARLESVFLPLLLRIATTPALLSYPLFSILSRLCLQNPQVSEGQGQMLHAMQQRRLKHHALQCAA